MNMEVSEEELYEILKVIQDFDPAGVGARSLRECLLLQLKRKNGKDWNWPAVISGIFLMNSPKSTTKKFIKNWKFRKMN